MTDKTRKSKPGFEGSYWCCAAEFDEHEADCPNASSVVEALPTEDTRATEENKMNMCHHGIDEHVVKCETCKIEKAAELYLESQGLRPVAVPESGNCLCELVGEPGYISLDARIWTILRDTATKLAEATRELEQLKDKERDELIARITPSNLHKEQGAELGEMGKK